MVKQISDNEIYLLIKYIKSVLWRVAKRLSFIEEARCLKVNVTVSGIVHKYTGWILFLSAQHNVLDTDKKFKFSTGNLCSNNLYTAYKFLRTNIF